MAKVFGFTTRDGGYRCVDVRLYHMNTDEDVFWSKRKNSYVLVEVPLPSGSRPTLTMPEGRVVRLVSINGIGEVRWEAMDYQLRSLTESTPTPGCDSEEILLAARHFKLSYDGKVL